MLILPYKRAIRSSSRLNSVPEKLKIYFTRQDENYFSPDETDDVFVLGALKKEKQILEEIQVGTELRVMEHH